MSTEDMILEELKQKGTFKARPLNKKILEGRSSNLPKVEKQPLTEC